MGITCRQLSFGKGMRILLNSCIFAISNQLITHNEGIHTVDEAFRLALQEVHRLGHFAQHSVSRVQCLLVHDPDPYPEHPLQNGSQRPGVPLHGVGQRKPEGRSYEQLLLLRHRTDSHARPRDDTGVHGSLSGLHWRCRKKGS